MVNNLRTKPNLSRLDMAMLRRSPAIDSCLIDVNQALYVAHPYEWGSTSWHVASLETNRETCLEITEHLGDGWLTWLIGQLRLDLRVQ